MKSTHIYSEHNPHIATHTSRSFVTPRTQNCSSPRHQNPEPFLAAQSQTFLAPRNPEPSSRRAIQNLPDLSHSAAAVVAAAAAAVAVAAGCDSHLWSSKILTLPFCFSSSIATDIDYFQLEPSPRPTLDVCLDHPVCVRVVRPTISGSSRAADPTS
jgi:hypothetical protein